MSDTTDSPTTPEVTPAEAPATSPTPETPTAPEVPQEVTANAPEATDENAPEQTTEAPTAAPTESAPSETPASEPATEAPASEPEVPAEVTTPSEQAAPATEEVTPQPVVSKPAIPAGALGSTPVDVKNKLAEVHSEIAATVNELRTSNIAVAHDVEDIVMVLEEAKAWIVDKVTKYDPALGDELSKQ